ncbi:MAG: hydroxymethylbilane synthase [Roseiarcus sp.]|jgi:hydroxymethylbilane synthase
MASSILFTLGTRGSPLALAQAHETRRLLARAHGWDEGAIALEIIRTSGDMIQDRPLAEAGGKGLFTKEIDAALLEGRIDAAVHSAKDLPTLLPEGVAIAGFLEREDVRDALISAVADSILALPQGARLGAASLRRQAQARRLRPDLRIELLRGNVETRLRKAESKEIDATLLALAGLKRLGFAHRARAILDIETFLPAVGQGAIALTAQTRDARAHAALAPIVHAETGIALTAERAFLAELEGSCRTPIAGHARLIGGALVLVGQVLREDGSESFDVRATGAPADAERLGTQAGRDLAGRVPPGVLPSAKAPAAR